MTMIVSPHAGRAIKRITVHVDGEGNMKIDAVDLRPVPTLSGGMIPGQTTNVPLTALETMFWLSKVVTDSLGTSIKQIEKASKGAADGDEQKRIQ